MKLPGKLNLSKSPVASTSVTPIPLPTPRRKMSFQEFSQSFNSLDTQNPGSWPLPVKWTVFAFVTLLTALAGYWFFIRPVMDEISAQRDEQETLLEQYRDKSSKLRNLKAYQLQVFQMEQDFGQLLQQLPKQNEIPGLVEDINIAGVRAGVQFNKINVENEATKDLFIELPIAIEARGDYHAFGNFVSNMAALPRILTAHDFIIAPVNNSNGTEIPILNFSLTAKTYRLNDQPKDKTADKKKDGDTTGSAS